MYRLPNILQCAQPLVCSHCVDVCDVGLCAWVCLDVSVCKGASLTKQHVYMKRKNDYYSFPLWPLYITLQHSLKAGSIGNAGWRFHFSPTSVSSPSFLPFIEGKSLRVLMKVKWMKAKGDGWEVITACFLWVRTHKLITWYWWRTSTRHLDTSTFTTSTSFGPFQTGKHKGVIQEQFPTQVTFKNSHKKNLWRPI